MCEVVTEANKFWRCWHKPTNVWGVGWNQSFTVPGSPGWKSLQISKRLYAVSPGSHDITSRVTSHHLQGHITSQGHFTSTSSPGYKMEISANLKETVCSKFPEHRCFKEGVYFHGTTLALSKLLCSLKWHTSLYVVVCKSCSKKVRGYHIYMCVRACREDL